MVMTSTENVDQLPGSTKSSLAKEKNSEEIAKIEQLFAEGYRLFLSKELETAAEKFGEANELAVGLYGQFAPECFKPHYYYGLTMLEIAQNEAQLVKAPQDDEETEEEEEGESGDEAPNGNAAEVVKTTDAEAEKVDENTAEQSSAAASAGEITSELSVENGKNGAVADETLKTEAGDATGHEDEEDGDEPSTEVLAWESLEVARKICEKLEISSSEWSEKKAEVLIALSDCMIIAEEYETALNDLNSALEIQKKLFTPHDRRIAETLYHIGRCHRNSNDFEKATVSFKAAGRELQSLVDAIESQGEAATEDERKTAVDLATIIAEIEEAAQDALESGEARKKQIEESREIVANVFKQALSADAATNDISAMLTRKRPAPSSSGDSAVVVEPPTNSSGTAPTTATTTNAEANNEEKLNGGDSATKTTDVHTASSGIEMEAVTAAPEGKKPKIGEE